MQLATVFALAGVLFAVLLVVYYDYRRHRKLADLNVNTGKSIENAVRDLFVIYLKSLRKNLAATEKQMAQTELPKDLHQTLASPAREWREKRWVDAVNEMMKRDKTATEMALSTLLYRQTSPYDPVKPRTYAQGRSEGPFRSDKKEPADTNGKVHAM